MSRNDCAQHCSKAGQPRQNLAGCKTLAKQPSLKIPTGSFPTTPQSYKTNLKHPSRRLPKIGLRPRLGQSRDPKPRPPEHHNVCTSRRQRPHIQRSRQPRARRSIKARARAFFRRRNEEGRRRRRAQHAGPVEAPAAAAELVHAHEWSSPRGGPHSPRTVPERQTMGRPFVFPYIAPGGAGDQPR